MKNLLLLTIYKPVFYAQIFFRLARLFFNNYFRYLITNVPKLNKSKYYFPYQSMHFLYIHTFSHIPIVIHSMIK